MRVTIAILPLLASGCTPYLYTSADSTGQGRVACEGTQDNAWPHVDTPSEDLRGEGWGVGQVAPDFCVEDQYGDNVSLWQFEGNMVLVDISTIWCAPCQELATGAEETYQDFKDEGFVYLTVLQQDLEGEPPELDDLNLWVDEFGITAPVVGDGDGYWTGAAVQQGQFPALLLLDRDMKVIERVNPATDEAAREALEEHL